MTRKEFDREVAVITAQRDIAMRNVLQLADAIWAVIKDRVHEEVDSALSDHLRSSHEAY